jgi:hypothetical protein
MTVRQLVAADDLDGIGNLLEEFGHVLEKGPTVPIQRRFVLSHPAASASGKHESGHWGWR